MYLYFTSLGAVCKWSLFGLNCPTQILDERYNLYNVN